MTHSLTHTIARPLAASIVVQTRYTPEITTELIYWYLPLALSQSGEIYSFSRFSFLHFFGDIYIVCAAIVSPPLVRAPLYLKCVFVMAQLAWPAFAVLTLDDATGYWGLSYCSSFIYIEIDHWQCVSAASAPALTYIQFKCASKQINKPLWIIFAEHFSTPLLCVRERGPDK